MEELTLLLLLLLLAGWLLVAPILALVRASDARRRAEQAENQMAGMRQQLARIQREFTELQAAAARNGFYQTESQAPSTEPVPPPPPPPAAAEMWVAEPPLEPQATPPPLPPFPPCELPISYSVIVVRASRAMPKMRSMGEMVLASSVSKDIRKSDCT